MLSYIKWIVALILLVAIAAQDVWIGVRFYSKGKDSVFTNVLAGTATTIKQEDKNADAAVAQAAADATKITTLKKEADDLRKKLQASAASNPRPDCKLSDDELQSLQALAGSTK